ncbi:MAG: ankyrin repeat domain-containing protein, partial [Waterburya sp.]
MVSSLATQSFKFIPITLIIYWISLGIVEWKLLSPHISKAYSWGLLTIVGGIIGFCLIGLVYGLILLFLLRNASVVGLGGSLPSQQELLMSLMILIICLFTVGFLLGFGQNLIAKNSLSQTNNEIAIITGLAWLIGSISYIIFIFFVKSNPLIYIILVTLIGGISSFPKGLILGKMFYETENLPSDALLWKELTKIGVFLVAMAIISYPFRYPILQSLGFTGFLYDAVMEGKINAEDFLSHGGNPNIDDGGNNILHRAVSRENLALIKLLLSHGADVNKPDDRGDTPLLYSRANNKKIVKLLIDNGANVNTQNEYGTSILHFDTNKEIVELLITNGANVNAQTSKGETPLHKKTLDKEVAQLLLTNGANPNFKDRNERMPLHQVESVEFAEVLIANSADINAPGWMGFTPLHFSIDNRKMEITKLLLKHDADINAKDSIKRTPLHLANTLEVAQLLVNQGADLNAKDKEGWTPLHTIVQNSGSPYLEIAKLFLDRGV